MLRKITLLIAAITLLCTAGLHAQIEVGGILGVNIASISVDPEPSDEDYSSLVGFAIGGVLEYGFSENLSFRTEPMYLGKGVSVEDDDFDAEFKLAYLELPLLIKYQFSMEGGISPYVMAGPQIGLLLSAKYDFGNDNEFDAKDDTKGLDFGLGLGAGVEIPSDAMRFFAQLRYVIGLSDINDDESDNTELKNKGLQIHVGVLFPL